jgi:hypothetical protein
VFKFKYKCKTTVKIKLNILGIKTDLEITKENKK